MTELWLKYKDETSEAKRVLADKEKFALGRTPDNDFAYSNEKLSRKHSLIERFADIFMISDLQSSNGTFLNGERLEKPAALKNGDKIDLGGGLQIEVEIVSDAANDAAAQATNESAEQAQIASQISLADGVSAGVGNSIAPSLFIIAPILGVLILVFAGGLLLLFGGKKEAAGGNTFVRPSDETPERKTPKPRDTENSDAPPPNVKSSETPSNQTIETPPTQAANELDKVEKNALSFVKRIALNDENYAFTQKQLGEINQRIKNFKGSATLRDNLKSVKQNASQFSELAKTKGLKPQFLAAAALAKIGNSSGNPLATAQAMLPVLSDLKIKLGNELADDNLLVIAAYDQGARGDFSSLRNTLEALSKQTTGVGSREVRTIWFLRERGKISDAEYEFALRFLAVGAITQNPSDFNVETEPIIFN